MNSSPVISSHIRLKKQGVFCNGEMLASSQEDDFGGYMKRLYKGKEVKYPKFFKMDDMCKLAFLGAEWLVQKTQLTGRYANEDIGVILTNAASSLHTDRNYQETIANRSDYYPSPGLFVYTLPNIAAGEICIRHKICGENAFFVLDQFDPAFLCDYINDLFDRGQIQACISGWIERDGNHFDSFLYTVENAGKAPNGLRWDHQPNQLLTIFNQKPWIT